MSSVRAKRMGGEGRKAGIHGEQRVKSEEKGGFRKTKGKGELTIPGYTLFNASAAHSALGFPPSRQSANSNNGCLTGLEKETVEESRRVMFRTPQPYSGRKEEERERRRVSIGLVRRNEREEETKKGVK